MAPTITRTPITDDDGTGTTGTILDNAWLQQIYDQIDALAIALAGGTQTTTVTGTQDNFALTTGCGLLRVNNASLVTFRGFSAGVDGQQLVVVSIGAGEVDFAHENTNSSAANRLHNFATVGNTPLAAGVGTAVFRYDGTTQRWRLIHHEQGAWISVPYSAGNFSTFAGAGTWTVDSGDQKRFAYWLKGRTLHLSFNFNGTTVSSASAVLQVTPPGGFLLADYPNYQDMFYFLTSSTAGVGKVYSTSSNLLDFDPFVAVWNTGANVTSIWVELTFDVQ